MEKAIMLNPDYDGDRGVKHGKADATVTAVHGVDIIAIAFYLLAEAIDIMDGVINGNAHADRGNGDGHHVQRNTQPPHGAEHHPDRKQIGEQGDQGQFDRAKKDEKHDQQRPHHNADGLDLRRKQALQHVVVQYHGAGQMNLFRRMPSCSVRSALIFLSKPSRCRDSIESMTRTENRVSSFSMER